jgi:uncharacterized damage-inducible protein DinB
MVRVKYVLESWKDVRADTARAVEDFPESGEPFQPIPGVAGFGEIARHILDAGHAITGMVLAGAEDLSRNFRAELSKHVHPLPVDAGAAALAAALREAVQERCAQLDVRAPEWWAGMITRWDGQRVTRLELIQTLKEHELTHRSQLFLYLRMKGIVPATTLRRLAQQAQPTRS